jgi:hypothetical protein
MKQSRSSSTIWRLAKFELGQKAFCVVLGSDVADFTIMPDDSWVTSDRVHPKVLYERGIINGVWPTRWKLPRLNAMDFLLLMDLFTSTPLVEEFIIKDLRRCQHTGECVYQSTVGNWMPESCLFPSLIQAQRELRRILRLVRRWATH